MCDADKWQKTTPVEMEQSLFIKVYGHQAASMGCVPVEGEAHHLLKIIILDLPQLVRLLSNAHSFRVAIILNAGSLSSEHFLLWACLVEEEA